MPAGRDASTWSSPTCPTSPRRDGPSLQPEVTRVGAARGAARRPRRPRRLSRPARRSGPPECADQRRRCAGAARSGEGQAERGRASCCATPGFGAIRGAPRPRRDRAGGGGGAMSAEIVSIERGRGGARRAPRWSAASPAGGVAVFPADGLYGLACDPLDAAAIARIHRIKGRDDGKPSAVMYFSPLAMRELVAEPRPAHPRRGRRAAARPGHPGRRQPRAPLSARLPRGPRAPRRPPDRRPAGRGDVPALPDLGQPQRRAGAVALRRGPRARSSPPPTWRSTAAS